jgi:hypothetical protein
MKLFMMNAFLNAGKELNQKMLISSTFLTKNDILCDDDN